MERVLHAFDAHLAHPSLPRTLAAQLRSAGFGDVRVEAHAFATDELTPQSYGGAILPLIEDFVRRRDRIGRDEAAAWAAEQRELGERGAFFFACIQLCFTATRG
jgi:hypothetical protein